MAKLAAPAEVDPRLVMSITNAENADERAELQAAADEQRVEANARARAELAERKRTGEPFRLPRWKAIDRAIRETGAEVADRAFTEYEVGPDDVVRPIAKGYGVHREEWTGDGWAHVPSIVRPPTRPDDAAAPAQRRQD